MKNLLLFLAAIIIFTTNSFSQIKQGTWMCGGTLGLNGSSSNYTSPSSINGSNDSKGKSLNINGKVGYFLRDNLVIGLSPEYIHSNTYSTSFNGTTIDGHSKGYSNSYGISTFIRKYKQLFNSKVYIFGQASVNLSYSNSATYYTNSLNNPNNFTYTLRQTSEGISLSPGINYFISERIALEVIFAGLGLSTTKSIYNYDGPVNSNYNSIYNVRRFNYTFNLNLASINLGIQFFIGKKQDAAKKEGL
jgi:hypothetical protein